MTIGAARCNVQGATCNVQGATCNVQGATCNVQGATCQVQGASKLLTTRARRTHAARCTSSMHAARARCTLHVARCTIATLLLSAVVNAQGRGGTPAAPKTPKEAARLDLTGYWVSIVTEDWRFRMVTAPKGDYPNVPLNAEGKKVADAWDPAKDEAARDRCKGYGAPNIMRQPGRFHITWADDATLKIETDAGMQTGLFRFNAAAVPVGRPQRHGYSVAEWFGRGSLKVVTAGLLPGYP